MLDGGDHLAHDAREEHQRVAPRRFADVVHDPDDGGVGRVLGLVERHGGLAAAHVEHQLPGRGRDQVDRRRTGRPPRRLARRIAAPRSSSMREPFQDGTFSVATTVPTTRAK